jgi:hypothetical protein
MEVAFAREEDFRFAPYTIVWDQPAPPGMARQDYVKLYRHLTAPAQTVPPTTTAPSNAGDAAAFAEWANRAAGVASVDARVLAERAMVATRAFANRLRSFRTVYPVYADRPVKLTPADQIVPTLTLAAAVIEKGRGFQIVRPFEGAGDHDLTLYVSLEAAVGAVFASRPVSARPASPAGLFDDAEVISSYSRAQGMEDGVLVDVSTTAREAGIKFPAALTRGAWAEAVEWTRTAGLQDESGRLWDVFTMFKDAIRRTNGQTDRVAFTVMRVPNRGKGLSPQKLQLIGVIGPGDTPEPVITIMLPNED